METKIYAAYGSNMNLKQMAGRCPAARTAGTGMLIGHRLTFRQGVANIEPARGRRVPILLWEITPECEVALDRYEGYPRLYTKKEISVTLEDGTKTKAMAYIMTKQHWAHPGAPNGYYLKTIQDGYRENDLPSKFLRDAVAENRRECDEYQTKQKPWAAMARGKYPTFSAEQEDD